MEKTQHPRVGVGAFILNEKQELLLVLRKKEPEANHWSIPGGKVEWMENVEDTVIREIKEEVGVTIQIDSLLCITNHILPEEETHWVCPTYKSRIHKGTVKNCEPEAIIDIGWFSLQEMPTPLTLTTKKALENFFNHLEGQKI
ncbi:NUDIX domain-containing protein [Bacillus inaquosorum]|uniref:NUDIX domain-containing protein n=1 Tax=Bacillus inaquosorum TaxID=483913 RepID=UPI003F175613